MPKIQSYVESMQWETGTGCSQKAVIVTGDEDLRSMLKYALDSYGMQVLFCQDGAEVLAFAMIDPFDCIIIDCDTPGMDGIDLTRRLREQFAFAIIIGLGKEDRGTAYLQAGANDFLQNPFVPYRLAMMLDSRDILA
jgi:DNA-binding response OmpR family regulator